MESKELNSQEILREAKHIFNTTIVRGLHRLIIDYVYKNTPNHNTLVDSQKMKKPNILKAYLPLRTDIAHKYNEYPDTWMKKSLEEEILKCKESHAPEANAFSLSDLEEPDLVSMPKLWKFTIAFYQIKA